MLAESDYMNEVLQKLQGADLESALRVLGEALQSHPQDARLLLLMAGQYASGQDYDRAEALYIATLHQTPDFAIARFQLGLLQFTSGRPIAALATWAPLEALPERHALRLFVQAFNSLTQNQFDEACQFLREGMVANTENPPLNKDMDLLLQRVLQSGLTTSSEPPSEAPEGPTEENPSGTTNPTHFLLSNYRKQD